MANGHRLRPTLVALVALLLVGTACQAADRLPPRRAISLAELPAGLGRGLPQVDLGGVAAPTQPLTVGGPAPAFYLRLEDGRAVSSESLVGRPVLINFWASWCGPCRLEMPEIVRAAAEYSDLVVLAVNVEEEPEAIRAFLEEYQMALPVVLDPTGDLRQRYEVRGLPSSLFIDRTGAIHAIWNGVLTAELLAERLAEIL